MAKNKLTLKAAGERFLKKLKEKAGHMGEEINDNFSRMEADLLKTTEESEAFYKGFSKHQNQHFDAIDNFVLRKERAP